MKRAYGWDKEDDARVLRHPTPAVLPTSVPALPGSYLVRAQLMKALGDMLLKEEAAGSSSQAAVVVQGMGGSGKSSIVVGTVRDEVIRRSFDTILWVSIGQVTHERRRRTYTRGCPLPTRTGTTSFSRLDLTSHPFIVSLYAGSGHWSAPSRAGPPDQRKAPPTRCDGGRGAGPAEGSRPGGLARAG